MPDPNQADERSAVARTGATDRTLAVLELLAANPQGLLISAIAEMLTIPLSATHRLLAELAQRGYVRQERGYGAYQPTTKLVSLAFTYLAASGISDIAQPILDRLAAATGELVRLTVVDGDRLTWVAKDKARTPAFVTTRRRAKTRRFRVRPPVSPGWPA